MNNTKRIFGVFVLGMFLISMMGFVFAAEDYSDEAVAAAHTFKETLVQILGPLFGDQEMLSRVFMAMLLGLIIFSIVTTMFKDSGRVTKWGITLAITSLALLGIPAEFLQVIRMQYGAMGATVLTLIPFIILLAFSLKSESVLIARVTWIFYAFYYLAMYLYKISSLVDGGAGWLSTETLPYLAGFLAGVFLFTTVKLLRNLIFKGEIEGITERGMTKVKRRKALQDIQDEDLGRYSS